MLVKRGNKLTGGNVVSVGLQGSFASMMDRFYLGT
jgi:hypothetical protein